MTENIVAPPSTGSDEEARKAAAMHRVYSYLLQLAARKEAANRKVSETSNLSAADEALAVEPNAQKGV